ncbi:MAG: DNA-3-methyladenine glycosylase I [Parachlamydiaceae bacterium]
MVKQRCTWVRTNDPLEEVYHDREWGDPVHDDRVHFEFLLLEGAQAGLSWHTILVRRENYRQAFAHFDPNIVASFQEKQIHELLVNEGIIRNRLKIASAVQNAQKFLDVQEEFGSFDRYVWRFVDGKPIQNCWAEIRDVPATSSEAHALSKDLRKRGFNFVGPTIMYAYMQAIGMVNDHLVGCFRHAELCEHHHA